MPYADDDSDYSKNVRNKLEEKSNVANSVTERWVPAIQEYGGDARGISTTKKALLFFLLTYYQEFYQRKILKSNVSRR